jgi:hypothetical protein
LARGNGLLIVPAGFLLEIVVIQPANNPELEIEEHR